MSLKTGGMPLSTVECVAAKFEEDMRRRGLRPGDRYFTASEAAKRFSISSMSAHRAMRSLAEREVLVRQRSRGTFIGPNFRGTTPLRPNNFDTVHLLMAMEYHITQDVSSDVIVDELSKIMPGMSVQVHHVDERDARRHASTLIERIGKSRREGIVLIRCSQDVQAMVAGSSIPAVVYGQAYPEIKLSSLGHNQELVGRLIAEHALQRGCKRFAVFTHKGWRRGDHMMVDSVMETLANAGVGLDAVRIRSLLPEWNVVAQAVSEMIHADEPADAFLCRNDFYARVVSEFTARGVPSRRRPRCIVSGGHGLPGPVPEFKRVVSTIGLAAQIESLGDLLDEAAAVGSRPRSVTLQVSLE